MITNFESKITFNFYRKSIIFFISLFCVFILYEILNRDKGLYALIGLVSLGLIVFFIRYPKIWIYATILGFGILLVNRGEEVSIVEIFIYGIALVGIAFFFIHRFFVQRVKIVKNLGDLIILFFFFFALFNSIIAYLNSVDLFWWLREYLTLCLVLLYFPIREIIKDKRSIRNFFISVAVAVLLAVADGYLTFRNTALLQAVYAYQLGSSIKMNQVVFGVTILTSVAFAIYHEKFWIRILLLFFALSSVIALILTYSRTFWIVVMLELAIMSLFINKTQRLRLVIYSSIFIIGVFFSTLFIFKQNAQVVFKLIEKRFVSSAKYRTDLSVLSRAAEYPVVYQSILENPLWGNGFAKEIRFRDPIFVRTNIKPIIHNGFTSLAFRLGVPLALAYWSFIFYYLFYSAKQFFQDKNSLSKAFYLSATLSLILFIISNFTFQQYIYREGIFSVIISVSTIWFGSKLSYRNDL